MIRTVAFTIAISLAPLWSQKLPDLYHEEVRGDGPYLIEPGWRPLLNGTDLTGWRGVDDAAHEWFTSRGVVWKRVWNPKLLVSRPEPGDRIVNGKQGKTANLVSDETFGSFELYLEFLIAEVQMPGCICMDCTRCRSSTALVIQVR